jgi:hypothetical protein
MGKGNRFLFNRIYIMRLYLMYDYLYHRQLDFMYGGGMYLK